MTAELVSAGAAVIAVASTGVATYTTLMVRAEVAMLRASIAEARRADMEEQRRWINGSFMRTSEIAARLDSLQREIDDLKS